MARIANDMTELVGKTPLVRLQNMSNEDVELIGKLEFFNPAGSIKDRIGFNMLQSAEQKGLIKKGSLIVEPTSGNTGIALAWMSAVKGYRLILTMPESMSRERVSMLKAFGAELRLTPAHLGMTGAIEEAESILKENPEAFMPQQFKNLSNPEIHRKTTAEEIWEDTDGEIDIFVAGVGTGGTITGVGETLKKYKPSVQIVAVEPNDSAVLSGEPSGPHKIQGIGAGFVPDILNKNIIDKIIRVKNEEARLTTVELAHKEGIFAGISSGANICAALQLASNPLNKGKKIVAMICDLGDRYLSTSLFEKL
ncbi:cysteine synthase A [PVC group bacterium (ex Bugula neritina AB1)]|nr:cysteine synthase A [PVC group bacterium (ex Bugula neritina AB1)]